jgi:hypothetical protein
MSQDAENETLTSDSAAEQQQQHDHNQPTDLAILRAEDLQLHRKIDDHERRNAWLESTRNVDWRDHYYAVMKQYLNLERERDQIKEAAEAARTLRECQVRVLGDTNEKLLSANAALKERLERDGYVGGFGVGEGMEDGFDWKDDSSTFRHVRLGYLKEEKVMAIRDSDGALLSSSASHTMLMTPDSRAQHGSLVVVANERLMRSTGPAPSCEQLGR